MKKGIFIGEAIERGNKHPAQIQVERKELTQFDGIHVPAAVDGSRFTACGINYEGFRTLETPLNVNCIGCRAVIKYYKNFRH